MKFIPYLLTLFISQFIFCQTDFAESKSKISSVLEDYFDLEREAIHLHINKTTFLTKESIWYQGYIIDRKTSKPFYTSNVFVLLLDEKGNKLSEKLIYANNGSFSGKFDLNKNLNSGIYYIQAYTNWMNNFKENESTLQKIIVINPLTGAKNYKKVNTNTLELTLNPEGGNLISGIQNSLGVQIKDCRGNAPADCEATLQTNTNEIISTTKLNQFGYGKFEFIPANNNSYKVVVNYENEKITKQLPKAEISGFAMKTNNYSIAGKTLVNIKTNLTTIRKLASKKVYLVIHQDQKHGINDISINESTLEQTFSIPTSELSPGINTIRIIDSDLKEYASRLIYVYPKIEKSITLSKSPQKNYQIHLTGLSKYPNATLSSAFLPEKSIACDDSNNIFTGITINPYLTENLEHANYYFNNPNRMQFYELDLVLLNQSNNKYNWEFMKVTKPVINFSFDSGLDLKGKIDPTLKDKPYLKSKLISYKNFLLLNSDISENGEYNFEHVLLPDSSYVELSLHKLPNFETINSKLTPQVLNRKRPFLKEFKIKIPEHCDDNLEELNLDFLNFINRSVIKLEEVKIENTKKPLRYENQIGNANLIGHKVQENEETQSLLQYIRFNGFDVDESNGHVAIYSRQRNSFNAAQTGPAIFIDGRQILDIVEIELMQMNEIDEIYLNPHAIVPSIRNFQGIIKIYRKKLRSNDVNNTKNPNSFYIAEGFSKNENFRNANYDFLGKNGFNSLGLLNWSNRIITDETGKFSVEFTDYNQQKGKTIIQGMTNEGVLFQEEAIIELK
ncbi:MAG: hypothetical protein ACI7YS_06330 [Flavobacterium sp.]